MRYRRGFVCPRCRCTVFDRSAVRWYERLRKVFDRARPYRCYQCRRRCWLHADAVTPDVAAAAPGGQPDRTSEPTTDVVANLTGLP
jgi:predicted nucleic-acid-binding Zn-ribbon protein